MSNLDDHALQTNAVVSHESGNMSDELNVWREAVRRSANCAFADVDAPDELAAAVIRSYGDKRYQQAIADVVEWLRVQQHGRTSDNYPGYYARQIEQRFGKDA